MAPQNRRKSTYLIEKIESEPWRFDFFQLVRLLEKQAHSNEQTNQDVGEFAPVNRESVRFKSNPHLNFEPAPVKTVKRKEEQSEKNSNEPFNTQWELEVNFWGLNGSAGVLPFHYSELIIQRLRAKDHGLRDFLDIFNHRSLSLFYRSWQKHRPWLKHPGKNDTVSKYHTNWHQEILKSLTGLSGEQDASFNKPEGAWLNYAGFGAARVCNPSMLKQAIHHHFGLSVRINQFKGQWEQMPQDVRTRLADRKSNGMNNALGANALLGKRCWNAQNRFEVEIVDIEYEQFMKFSPGSHNLNALYELIKFKVGTELDFDLTLKVRESRLKSASFNSGDRPQLGWNSRLHNQKKSDEIIKISVSKHGMHRLATEQKQTG